ncbi:MAG TPA: MOSC N-terminal beta barrel domain-containing protein [Polyangiaceae bacterium]|nr:MOSC N-terminal beta barrel domain-containing protein [Polyangiaceae bacterium]
MSSENGGAMRLSGLYVYPVKACRGVSLQASRVVERGFEFDRRYMIVDDAGAFVTQRTRHELALVDVNMVGSGFELCAPGAPSLALESAHESGPRRDVRVWDHDGVGVEHEPGSAWFSRYLGSPHRLVYMPSDHERPVNPARAREGDLVSFADSYPFLLISRASLDELNRRMPAPLSMRRFRPNLVVDGALPFAEDGFAHVRIGALHFRGVKRCDRCVVTTIDPETGAAGVEPLRTLAKFRKEDGKVWFGMNLIHDGPGLLQVGDAVVPEPG